MKIKKNKETGGTPSKRTISVSIFVETPQTQERADMS